MKLNKQEREIQALYASHALDLRQPNKAMLGQLKMAAENTLRKDRRINIRLSDHDLAGIQRVAASKGLPYQSLISGLIHQFVEGDLIGKSNG
jgi:predicted DNA binding CopG/RHH family protein